MKVIYNNKIISEKNFVLPVNHRGLSYGDGLFETIIYKNGRVCYLDKHLERLQNGMAALAMQGCEIFHQDQILKRILALIKLNKIDTPYARIKIMVWRKNGGLFVPEDNHIDYMIAVNRQENKIRAPIEAEISKQVRLYPTPYSRFKTCNMLPYIMAGIEKKQRNLREMLLLSHIGHIAECSSSNIFWAKDGQLFTPSLETGCIAGVMRSVVMEEMIDQGYPVKEVFEDPDVLYQADAVFSTNVSGIYNIKRIENKTYHDTSILSHLNSIIL